MNQKEVSELRRRWRPEKNAVSRIYGCYVNTNKEIIADLDESLGLMTQEEVEKYLGLFKKVLSGTLGKHLIDLVFSTQQVQNSEEHRLLSQLRNTELKDAQARKAFYEKVISNLDMGQDNYLILLAHDTYDVPHRGRDDRELEDSSEEVFSYILCAVCPLKDKKVELGYFHEENEFHTFAAKQLVAAPELGFLFPAFDDRRANIYNALFYAHKPDAVHQELIDALFCVESPLSPAEQKEGFEHALSEGLGEACSMEVFQAVHEQLCARLVAHKESKDPEPPVISLRELEAILADCGVKEQPRTAFRKRFEEYFGETALLNPANLIDAGHFRIKTEQATVTMIPEFSHLLEARVIDGRKYLLLPAGDGVEVNGLSVEVKGDGES